MHSSSSLLSGLLLHLLVCLHAGVTAAARPDRGGMHEPHASQHMRQLLHGSRPPGGWPVCSTCRLVSCNPNGTCSGHCRRNNQLRNCSNQNSLAGAIAAGIDAFVSIPIAPYVGCSVESGCSLRPSQIAPRGNFTVAASVSGAARARCETSSSLFDEYGACVCSYTDGNIGREALCEATASYEANVTRFDEFVEMVALEYELSAVIVTAGAVRFANEVAFVTVVEQPTLVDIEVEGIDLGPDIELAGRQTAADGEPAMAPDVVRSPRRGPRGTGAFRRG